MSADQKKSPRACAQRVVPQRWCCGDKVHYDLSTLAFEKLAVKSVGVINMQYRAITCDFKGGIIVYTDE